MGLSLQLASGLQFPEVRYHAVWQTGTTISINLSLQLKIEQHDSIGITPNKLYAVSPEDHIPDTTCTVQVHFTPLCHIFCVLVRKIFEDV